MRTSAGLTARVGVKTLASCLFAAVANNVIIPLAALAAATIPNSGSLPPGSDRMDDFAFQMGDVAATDIEMLWLVRIPDSVHEWPTKWKDLDGWEKKLLDKRKQITELLESLGSTAEKDFTTHAAPVWLLILAQDTKGDWLWTRCLVYETHAYNMPPTTPGEIGSHGVDTSSRFVAFLRRIAPVVVRETKGHELAEKNTTATRQCIYFRDGSLKTILPLQQGKPHGEAISYYRNGGVSLRIPYHQGKVHGCTRSYGRNGQLLEDKAYVLGQPHGWERIYANGSLVHELLYKNGMPVGNGALKDEDGRRTRQVP